MTAEAGAANHRVVLVDDVAEIRQILRLILEHAGPFEVVGEGRNGSEAVALAAELQPDLLVMDVEMRGGPTGWEVLPQIRHVAPDTAVVILSGSAADPLGSERAAMADAVLEKGLPPQELNDALQALLGDPTRRSTASPAPWTPSVVVPVAAVPEAQAVLDALLGATSDAVVVLSPTGEVRSWNPAARRRYRATDDEVIGRPFSSLPALDGVTTTRIDVAGGTVVVLAAGGTPAGAAGAPEVEALRRELERATTELEGFASVASHDLAQPLQVAYGYLEMVRSEFADGMDETAAQWIDAAVSSLERMRLLVQDILAFARSGNREVPAAPVDVEQAALAALDALRSLLDERAAEVTLRPPLPTVRGYDPHVSQILERLVDNAVRFVPPDRVPVVEVFAEEAPTEWVITVADNGPGIPRDLADRVFDLFYRGAKSTNSGTGLGLSISRKLVARMGGRIWVEDRPDGADGAWMRFALPKDLP